MALDYDSARDDNHCDGSTNNPNASSIADDDCRQHNDQYWQETTAVSDDTHQCQRPLHQCQSLDDFPQQCAHASPVVLTTTTSPPLLTTKKKLKDSSPTSVQASLTDYRLRNPTNNVVASQVEMSESRYEAKAANVSSVRSYASTPSMALLLEQKHAEQGCNNTTEKKTTSLPWLVKLMRSPVVTKHQGIARICTLLFFILWITTSYTLLNDVLARRYSLIEWDETGRPSMMHIRKVVMQEFHHHILQQVPVVSSSSSAATSFQQPTLRSPLTEHINGASRTVLGVDVDHSASSPSMTTELGVAQPSEEEPMRRKYRLAKQLSGSATCRFWVRDPLLLKELDVMDHLLNI
jgi:hypothetical protein